MEIHHNVEEYKATFSDETLQLHKKLASDLHKKIDLDVTFPLLLEATKEGYFDDDCLRGLVRDLLAFIRPPNEYTLPIDDETKNTVLTIVIQLAQFSSANRNIIEESGILGTALIDLLNYPNPKIQESVAKLLHFLSRSDQVNILFQKNFSQNFLLHSFLPKNILSKHIPLQLIFKQFMRTSYKGTIYKLSGSRIAKPWALNPLVALFVSSENMGVLDHLAACFANLIPLDNLNIIGKQEVIDRIGFLLKNGSNSGKEYACFFVNNCLARKDTITHMIIKSGIPDILVDLLRSGLPDGGKKPLLISLGMLAEDFAEIQTSAVKMGVLAPISDMLLDNNQQFQDNCLDLMWTYASNHDINKMQILTAGFMEPLLAFARDFRTNSRSAQRALRVLAALSDCKMFPSVFGTQKLALFEDVLRCGDNPMVQCSVIILFHLATLDSEFREAILSMGLVKHVKEYIERLGETKASNPIFHDFVEEMEKPKKEEAKNCEGGGGGWFSSVSNYFWASSEALSAKFSMHHGVPPERWSVPQVCDWLNRYWYSQYTETFSKHLVNGALLLDLNDSDLQDLGVTDKFHRRGILKQIEVLKSSHH